MDVRAERGTDEVQNWEAGSGNWTLEQSEARMKSKTGRLGTWIGRLEQSETRMKSKTGKLESGIHII